MLAGASIGREGPSLPVGAALMLAWGDFWKRRMQLRGFIPESDHAGAAGGLAATRRLPASSSPSKSWGAVRCVGSAGPDRRRPPASWWWQCRATTRTGVWRRAAGPWHGDVDRHLRRDHGALGGICGRLPAKAHRRTGPPGAPGSARIPSDGLHHGSGVGGDGLARPAVFTAPVRRTTLLVGHDTVPAGFGLASWRLPSRRIKQVFWWHLSRPR